LFRGRHFLRVQGHLRRHRRQNRRFPQFSLVLIRLHPPHLLLSK
jgi:hypothetical protein